MIVQKVLGNCFRNLVKDHFGNDLATLQDVHKDRLVDKNIATIDLKNASDSISWELVQFLFPKGIVRALSRARSEMILGPDESYYILKKVSSMGNGFTFELMTLILTALCRTLDPTSSVYGDDIIIANEHAYRLISALESVGFKVNLEKSFINSPFRESCGGNYHDDFGYIKSYDFIFPKTIHDQIIFFNKLNELDHIEFFRILRDDLLSVLDPALRGPRYCEPFDSSEGGDYRTIHGLSGFFRTDIDKVILKRFKKIRQQISLRYHYDIDSIEIFAGFTFKPTELTKMSSNLSSKQVGKYSMYLHAGRRCKDTLTGNGKWIKTYYVSIEGRISTLSSLLAS